VNSIKIIGLPVVVSNRHRIVLDKNIRTLFRIQKNDSVLMNIEQGFLRISSCYEPTAAGGEKKNITIGRFNLPESWAKQNDIHLGDFVYLIATDTGIVICPKNIELLCIGGGL
jgi:bifunctional DNA-binding transcriptional regulator/antitoxin component of YhaV-PrlF toxin-antitoxin module